MGSLIRLTLKVEALAHRPAGHAQTTQALLPLSLSSSSSSPFLLFLPQCPNSMAFFTLPSSFPFSLSFLNFLPFSPSLYSFPFPQFLNSVASFLSLVLSPLPSSLIPFSPSFLSLISLSFSPSFLPQPLTLIPLFPSPPFGLPIHLNFPSPPFLPCPFPFNPKKTSQSNSALAGFFPYFFIQF